MRCLSIHSLLRKLGLACAVAFCLCLSAAAQTLTGAGQHHQSQQTESISSPTSAQTIVVGSEQDYPPFATGMTDATAGGFTVDLWKAVATEAGLNYTIQVKPFHSLLQAFKAGEIDVLINLAQSDDRRKFADFSVPNAIVHCAMFVRKGDSNIRSESDLAGKSIIVLNADLAHDYAVIKGWEKQLVLVDTAAHGIELLASGKHDVLLLSRLAGLQTLNSLGLKGVEALPAKVGFSQKFSFATQHGSTELLSQLNEGLAITKANGVYNTIYEKWFGVYEVREAGLGDLLRYFVPVVAFFLMLFGYLLYRRRVERHQSHAAMDTLLRQQSAILQNKLIGIVTVRDRIIIWANPAFEQMLGYSANALAGTPTANNFPSSDAYIAFGAAAYPALSVGGIYRTQTEHVRKDGSRIWVDVSGNMLDPSSGESLWGFIDITENKRLEEQVRAQAFHDPMTSLANRRMLNDRLGQAMALSKRSKRYGAVLALDLDNFKPLNDAHGHQLGDLLLIEAAKRLTGCVRQMDTVARVGGDEFVIVLAELDTEEAQAKVEAETIAEKIRITLADPYMLAIANAGEEVAKVLHRCTASIGLALFIDNETSQEDILNSADTAMYQAKKAGRNSIRFHVPESPHMI